MNALKEFQFSNKSITASSKVVRQLFELMENHEIVDISKQRIAFIAGVHKNTLSLWKRGHRSPNLVQFENVAHAMGYKLMLVKDDEFD